jgi:hypothetical protein
MLLATQKLDPLFIPLFCGFMVMWLVLWFGMNYLVGKGWRSFAARFGVATRPAGTVYVSSDMWFHNVMYRRLKVTLSDAGVYFHGALFRFCRPPFLIPWDRVNAVEKRPGIRRDFYKMHIEDNFDKLQLILPAIAEKDLSRYSRARPDTSPPKES